LILEKVHPEVGVIRGKRGTLRQAQCRFGGKIYRHRIRRLPRMFFAGSRC
jgi:hypothetical protein